MKHIFLNKKKAGFNVMSSRPLHSTHFSQYQASSAALGSLGDGDCYLMPKGQLCGWWGVRRTLCSGCLHQGLLDCTCGSLTYTMIVDCTQSWQLTVHNMIVDHKLWQLTVHYHDSLLYTIMINTMIVDCILTGTKHIACIAQYPKLPPFWPYPPPHSISATNEIPAAYKHRAAAR